MDFGEPTFDGLIDTGAQSSAIPEAEVRKIRVLAPQSIVKESMAHSFQIMVANGQVETPKSIFLVMENLSYSFKGSGHATRNTHVFPISLCKSKRLKTSTKSHGIITLPRGCNNPANDHTVV